MSVRRLALVVEDDPHIAKIVAMHLRDLGFDVCVVTDGVEALERSRDRHFDIVVLDIMLPRMDGFDVCQALRRVSPYVPVLILSARGEELDRLLGLELGADDYLTKPFSVRELVARIKALMRRTEAMNADRIQAPLALLQAGEFVIDRSRHLVTLAGLPLSLTGRELQLLTLFVQHPGRAFSRSELMHLVWGYAHDADAHTVNSHINRLRSKIEVDPASPRHLLTVRGVGYKLAVANRAQVD